MTWKEFMLHEKTPVKFTIATFFSVVGTIILGSIAVFGYVGGMKSEVGKTRGLLEEHKKASSIEIAQLEKEIEENKRNVEINRKDLVDQGLVIMQVKTIVLGIAKSQEELKTIILKR